MRTFEEKTDKYLSRFKSQNNLACHKVKKAIWKDFTRELKTTAKGNNNYRRRKTLIEYYEKKIDEYFAKLEIERSESEWAGILRLEQICNQSKLMDLEANVSEEDKLEVKEIFHDESDAFLARFDFHGKGESHKILKDLIIRSERQSRYDLALQGWDLSYGEVSLALLKKFGEEYGSIACEMNGFELGREHNPEHVVSWFFKEIEGQIDEIEMACRTQEWEHAGMIYFMELCGRKIPPRTSPYEDSYPEPSQELENSKKDVSPDPDLQLNSADPILELNTPESSINRLDESDEKDTRFTESEEAAEDGVCLLDNEAWESENEGSTDAGDESEDECDLFFELFVSVAESFFAQISDVYGELFLEYVIGALWEKATQHKFPKMELPTLNSLPAEDQSRMIADFFEELEGVMTSDCESKGDKFGSLLSFADNLCQEIYDTESIFESNSPEPAIVLPESRLGPEPSTNAESNSQESTEILPVPISELINPMPSTNRSVPTDGDATEHALLDPVRNSSSSDPADVLSEPMLEIDSLPNIITTNLSEALTEEEGITLENLTKFKGDDATATTAEETWDESGSLTSELELVIVPQSLHRTIDTDPNIGVQETRKERDRRLLRQHCATCRGPKERKKTFRHSRHQTRLDSIHENDGEEGRDQTSSTIPKDLRIAPVADSELEEVAINVRRLKSMQITRKRTRRRFWYQSQNKRRTKTSSNSSVCNNCWLQMVKWWAMTMIIGTYSCAANRYAKMRSNRRFKPGD